MSKPEPKLETNATEVPQNEPPDSNKLHEISKKSPFGALLSRTLPRYRGPYHIGVSDIEVPVDPQTFGSFTHKTMPKKSAGLAISTVLFTLFYPCQRPAKHKPVVWFPNMRQTIDGFLKMANRTPNFGYRMLAYPAAAAAISKTTFPADKDAPLLVPPEGKKWPLIIFSHGVGCSRLMYSAFCGEMASRGYVVAALEHRDGTSPASNITAEDGTTMHIDWLNWKDLHWPDLKEQPKDDTTLRHVQLELRCAEITAVIKTVTALSKGENIKRRSVTAPEYDWNIWTNVDPHDPIITGHSFGGSAALALSADNEFQFRAVIAMDPAVQRLEPWAKRLPHPLMFINSEEFTVGKEFKILAESIAGTTEHEDAPLVFSISGSTHPSFSDVFLILPEKINSMTGLRVDAALVLEHTIDATVDFLNGNKDKITKRAKPYDPKDCKEGKLKVRDPTTPAVDASKQLGDPPDLGIEIGEVPKPFRPIGSPGDLIWHQF